MKQPIKSGDACLVINGLGGPSKSPNIGKTVVVKTLRGEHSRWGRVWRCEGRGLVQLTDTGTYQTTNWADIPACWLQKIEPPTQSTTTSTKEEITA